MRGHVKLFFVERGFGFIIPENRGHRVLLHKDHIQASDLSKIGIGTLVEYELIPDLKPNLAKAMNVRVL